MQVRLGRAAGRACAREVLRVSGWRVVRKGGVRGEGTPLSAEIDGSGHRDFYCVCGFAKRQASGGEPGDISGFRKFLRCRGAGCVLRNPAHSGVDDEIIGDAAV